MAVAESAPDMSRRRHRRRRKKARAAWIPAPPHETLVFIVAGLRERRHALGISQIELDERIGTPTGLIGKYEAFIRRPSGQALSEWAQALGGYLTFVVGPPPSP